MKIKFETHHEKECINTNGTCLQGYLNASYEKLVELFGEPLEGNYKTDAEWEVQFSDGTIATIYNWKDGKNYCGESGVDIFDIESWHVGGNSSRSELMVNLAIGNIPIGTTHWHTGF